MIHENFNRVGKNDDLNNLILFISKKNYFNDYLNNYKLKYLNGGESIYLSDYLSHSRYKTKCCFLNIKQFTPLFRFQ